MGLRVSQYVVSVESLSLTHHTPFSCFLCSFTDGLQNFHANQMLRTAVEAKGRGSGPVKHV